MKIKYMTSFWVAGMVAAGQVAVFADELANDTEKAAQKIECDAALAQVARPAQTLADVKKIFVSPLGAGEGAELIRQNLINRLLETGNVSVVDSPDEADATLTGIGQLFSSSSFGASGGGSGSAYSYGAYPSYQSSSSFSASGGNYYSASLSVRLIGKFKQVLWVNQSQPGRQTSPYTGRRQMPYAGSPVGIGAGLLVGSLARTLTSGSRSGTSTATTPEGAILYVADSAAKSLAKAIRKERDTSQVGASHSPGNL